MGSNREKFNIAIAILEKFTIWTYPESSINTNILTQAFWGQNNLCEFTTQEHKLKKVILYTKTGFEHSFQVYNT